MSGAISNCSELREKAWSSCKDANQLGLTDQNLEMAATAVDVAR